jgi:putative ABC transport system substrate-binding protein
MTALGGAVTAPLAVRAQPNPIPLVGVLFTASPGPLTAPYVAAVRQGLTDMGYVDGQNAAIEYRWAEGRYDLLPTLAADLVNHKVDVIAAGGTPAARAAQSATTTIPIVFASGDDPVAAGLIASLARPGRNLTGVSGVYLELYPKRFELVFALAPQAKTIGLLVNPTNPLSERGIRYAQEAAGALGLHLHILKASTEAEIDAAFDLLTRSQVDALVVAIDALFITQRQQLVTLAARHAVPAIYPTRDFADAGGLMTYGASVTWVYRQVGIYAGRILKGEKPADLPVQQPTKFELVVNLRTAEVLDLTIPPSILARADEVIE